MFRVLEIRRKGRRWLGGFAWSSDGELLSALDHRGYLSVFRVTTGAEVGSCHVGYGVRQIAWIPESHLLHVVSEEGLATYAVAEPEGIVRHPQYDWLQDQARGLIAWSPSGQLIAADRGSYEFAVFFADGRVHRVVAVPNGRINAIAWASSDEHLAVAHGDHLDIVDLRNAAAARTFMDDQTVQRAHWGDAEGRLITVDSRGAGAIRRPAEAVMMGDTPKPPGRSWSFPVASGIVDLDVSTQSSHAWTLAWDGTIAKWDLGSESCVGTVEVALRPDGIFQCIACCPQTDTVASFGGDGNVSIAIWSSTEVVGLYRGRVSSDSGARAAADPTLLLDTLTPAATMPSGARGGDARPGGAPSSGGVKLRQRAEMLNGRYSFGRLLGVGGMGAVYEAEDTVEKRKVAVKLINQHQGDRDAAIRRFEREASAASAIDTEHITRVLDSGKDSETGVPFIVMEYLQGEDLDRLVHRVGSLPPPVALRIVAQACVGLQKAHEIDIVHRDIKPANIWLARRDGDPAITVKLLDFGIAKIKRPYVAGENLTGLTQTGMMLGTPLYMSPEQASGVKEIDHRTDIWSLGIVLYFALTGRTPRSHIEGFGQLIAALIMESIPSVRESAPEVSPEIAAIIDAALQRDCHDRYPSAAAMRQAIMALLDGDDHLDESMLAPLADGPRSADALGADSVAEGGSARATTMTLPPSRPGES